MVSLVGIAGEGKRVSSFSLHPQSAHSQTDEVGSQQHLIAVETFDEQQSLGASALAFTQQGDAAPFATIDSVVVEQSHSDPEMKISWSTPIPPIANINNVATKRGRRVLDFLFMADDPTK